MRPAIVVFEGAASLGCDPYEHFAKSQSQRGLRSRNSPTRTLSQNAYGADLSPRATVR